MNEAAAKPSPPLFPGPQTNTILLSGNLLSRKSATVFPALPMSSVTDTPRASALASITLESRGLIKTDHFLWLLTRISPILGSSSVLDMTPLSTLTHPCLARGAFG